MALLIAGCGSNPVPPPVMAHGVAVREPLVDPRPYGTADAAFGLDVLGAMCRSDPRANLVLSPSSLASGLGMAYLGARGGTARAMAGVLHLPAAGGQALAGGPAGPVGRAARSGWSGRDPGRQRSGLGRPDSPDRTYLPERRRHRLRRRPGEGAAADGSRAGQAGDQPGDRDRDPGPDPAVAAPGLAGRPHRLGADRRALPARRVGHAVRSRRDQPGPVHHRRGAPCHGSVHDQRLVPCGQRGRLDRGLASVPWRQAGDGSAAAAPGFGLAARCPPPRPWAR